MRTVAGVVAANYRRTAKWRSLETITYTQAKKELYAAMHREGGKRVDEYTWRFSDGSMLKAALTSFQIKAPLTIKGYTFLHRYTVCKMRQKKEEG